MTAISDICIYSEPRCETVRFDEIASHIRKILPGVPVRLKGPLLEKSLEPGSVANPESLAVSLARARLKRGDSPVTEDQQALPGEVDFELRRLKNTKSKVFGLVYDAYVFSDIFRNILGTAESRINRVNIIFTNQLIGTWDSADKRYHARAVVCGSPSIVSVAGIVEAPAKGTGYYIAKRRCESFGFSEEEKMELAREYAGDNIDHKDARLTEVVKGYAMQPIAYRITGEPFCSDPCCRLYNARWQSELIRAQLGAGYEYCQKHDSVFRQLSEIGGTTWT